MPDNFRLDGGGAIAKHFTVALLLQPGLEQLRGIVQRMELLWVARLVTLCDGALFRLYLTTVDGIAAIGLRYARVLLNSGHPERAESVFKEARKAGLKLGLSGTVSPIDHLLAE